MDSFIIPAFLVIFGFIALIGFAIILCVGLPLIIIAIVIGILITPFMVLIYGIKEFLTDLFRKLMP